MFRYTNYRYQAARNTVLNPQMLHPHENSRIQIAGMRGSVKEEMTLMMKSEIV